LSLETPVSLENLLKIGQLKPHPPESAEIDRLLIAARRNLRDAGVTTISPETRFDAAYKAVMQSALAALMMHGYRPDTNRPGHHMTVIQTLPLTIGLDSKRLIVLDTLRRQRNVADYTGDDVDVTSAEAEDCVSSPALSANSVQCGTLLNSPAHFLTL
jgi:hypothetical protein